MANLVGQQIDQYLIERHLARGGMADVYLARDATLQRAVALKVMLSGFMHDKGVIARFQREAQAIARLNHPNIVQIYTTGIAPEGQPYLAMQYIPGGSLQDWLTDLADRGQELSPQRALVIAGQVADALNSAHAAGTVHRDLKPSNILLQPDGTAVVTDLGIAAVQEATARLTQTGHIMGTPYYMSPEQAIGKAVDSRADIYALGIILYEMLCGSVPFTADSPLAVLSQHLYEPLPPLSERRRGLSPTTYQTVQICLQKEPAKRFQTAKHLRAALNQALHEESGLAPTEVLATPTSQPAIQPTSTRFPSRWSPYAGGAVVAIMVIVALVLLWLRGNEGEGNLLPTAVTQVSPALGQTIVPTAEPTANTLPSSTFVPTITSTSLPPNTAVPATATSTVTALPPSGTTVVPIQPIITENVNAPFFNIAPNIDGNLSEWLAVTPVLAAHRTFRHDDWDGSEDLTAVWYLAWDSDNLYLAVSVIDNIHAQNQTGNLIFQGDSVDMQLDTNRAADLSESMNSDDFQITFSPGDFNSLPPSVWRWTANDSGTIQNAPNHGIVLSAQRTESGYTVEAAIPWRDLNLAPSPGLVLGASLNATDNDQVGVAIQEVFYSHVDSRTLLSPNTWGTLTLTPGN